MIVLRLANAQKKKNKEMTQGVEKCMPIKVKSVSFLMGFIYVPVEVNLGQSKAPGNLIFQDRFRDRKL